MDVVPGTATAKRREARKIGDDEGRPLIATVVHAIMDADPEAPRALKEVCKRRPGPETRCVGILNRPMDAISDAQPQDSQRCPGGLEASLMMKRSSF